MPATTRTDPIPPRSKASGRVCADALQPGAAIDAAGDEIAERLGRGRFDTGALERVDQQRDELEALGGLRHRGAYLLARDAAAEQFAGAAVARVLRARGRDEVARSGQTDEG